MGGDGMGGDGMGGDGMGGDGRARAVEAEVLEDVRESERLNKEREHADDGVERREEVVPVAWDERGWKWWMQQPGRCEDRAV
jgi:hypothetical protein